MNRNTPISSRASERRIFRSVMWEDARRRAAGDALDTIHDYRKIAADFVDKASSYRLELRSAKFNGGSVSDLSRMVETDLDRLTTAVDNLLRQRYSSRARMLRPVIAATASGACDRSLCVIVLIEFQGILQADARACLESFLESLRPTWGRQGPAFPLVHDQRDFDDIVAALNNHVNDLTGEVGLKLFSAPQDRRAKTSKRNRPDC